MTEHSHRKVPLSRHPLFPAIVAGWFGALLGIGALAIRTSALENAVLALRIDALVPAAAPPLGLTARALLALALMLVGALAGYVLASFAARRGARAAPAPAPVADAQVSSGAEDDDDLVRLAAARATLPQRRRALTMEELPEPEPAPAVRVERTGPSILNVGDLDAISPLIQSGAAPDEPGAAAQPAPLVAPQPATDGTAAERLRSAPLASLGVAELVERFALALAARRARPRQAAAETVLPDAPASLAAEAAQAGPLPPLAAPFSDSSRPAAMLSPARPGPDSRPFAMPPSLREPGLGNIEWFDEAEEEATLDSLLPPKRPLAHDPLKSAAAALPAELAVEKAFGEEEFEEEVATGEMAERTGSAEADAPFSSLLDMKPSARQPAALGSFVRIEDGDLPEIAEPVVVFPGQAVPTAAVPARLPGAPFGASPVDTEAALREALSALQRMSSTG